MNSKTTYGARRDFGDTHIDQIRKLLSTLAPCDPFYVVKSTDHQDMKEATDLLHPYLGKIAMRIRDCEYYERYSNQFTLRTSGRNTEYDKLKSGNVDYYFYGFRDKQGNLAQWVFMEVCNDFFSKPIEAKQNRDYSTFQAYYINNAAVVASGTADRVYKPFELLRMRAVA